MPLIFQLEARRDRGHPCFRNFFSTNPVYVVRAKSYVNRLFDPTVVQESLLCTKEDHDQ